MASFVLAIDQGTTSTRAIVFGADMSVAALAQQEFPQHFPADGEVEHDPEDLWSSTVATCREAMRKAGATASDIAAIGITNQRETTLVWDRATGQPLHRAIVWQDRRTADACTSLRERGHEPAFAAKTGLLLDPYFSGTKLAWLLDHVPDARARAARGELAFGTVDTYLLWRLTGGKVHATDATNASRTLLFDIHRGRWDDELLALLGVPKSVLPDVRDSSAAFGVTDPALFGGPIPICGIAGDQQAALIGQACFTPGMVKSTYGTGCFAVLNTGSDAGRIQQQTPDDDRLSARRRTHLCARRLDLRRRRGGAMAARQSANRRQCGGDRRARRSSRSDARRHSGAGLRRPRRTLLAAGRARRFVWADARHRSAPNSRRPRSTASVSRPPISSPPCGPTGRRRRTR